MSLLVSVPDEMGGLPLGFLVLGTERAGVRRNGCGIELKSTMGAQKALPDKEL